MITYWKWKFINQNTLSEESYVSVWIVICNVTRFWNIRRVNTINISGRSVIYVVIIGMFSKSIEYVDLLTIKVDNATVMVFIFYVNNTNVEY